MLRSFRLAILVAVIVVVAYLAWRPGSVVRDGRDDLGRNGMWIAHGWMGADSWFAQNGREKQRARYRSPESLSQLSELCRREHITDLFPHVCPCDARGNLPAIDAEQTERFLDVIAARCRVIPWIGGTQGAANCAKTEWRDAFAKSAKELLLAHPRLSGVQVNIEPMPSGDPDFLELLRLLRKTIPAEKILSVAAYPPPTRWQPSSDVHWDQAYFQAVAAEVDQLAVMMYDSGIKTPKFYTQLMASWTREVVAWSQGKPVLLGVPAYDDATIGASYHLPAVENLESSLPGIHAGLSGVRNGGSYQGVAIYSHWEMDERKWRVWEENFRKREE